MEDIYLEGEIELDRDGQRARKGGKEDGYKKWRETEKNRGHLREIMGT